MVAQISPPRVRVDLEFWVGIANIASVNSMGALGWCRTNQRASLVVVQTPRG